MARRAQHMSLAAPIAALPGVAAFGGALEQTNQSVDLLFESGTYLEFESTFASPRVRGTDALGFSTGNVIPRYGLGSLGFKTDLSDRVSFGLLIDQPFGITVDYGPSSPVFAGTIARSTARR